MTALTEIRQSLIGCYKLAIRDKDALGYFNLTASGFWFSFVAVLIAIPVLCLENYLEFSQISTPLDLTDVLTFTVIATACAWSLYLIVTGVIVKLLNLSDKFVFFVITYNWTQFALILLWLPISILTMGLMGPEVADMFRLLYIGASYVFLWYILVASLEVPGPIAAALTFLEFILALLVQKTVLTMVLSIGSDQIS